MFVLLFQRICLYSRQMRLDCQAVDTIEEDIDTLQATLSPVDGLCLAELTNSSVAELLLTDLPSAASDCALSPLPQCSFTDTSSRHLVSKPLTDELLMSSYSSLPLPPDVDVLLPNAPFCHQDDLQSLLPSVTKLSSDVLLSEDRHALLLPEAAAADFDALDTLQLTAAEPLAAACELDTDDFVLDDADWSSVQVCVLSTLYSLTFCCAQQARCISALV